jgi:hypothetical protein
LIIAVLQVFDESGKLPATIILADEEISLIIEKA